MLELDARDGDYLMIRYYATLCYYAGPVLCVLAVMGLCVWAVIIVTN